jgi:hypothetical protein
MQSIPRFQRKNHMRTDRNTCISYIRVAQESLNLKHSLVLTGMFSFKPASQFEERYHSVVS